MAPRPGRTAVWRRGSLRAGAVAAFLVLGAEPAALQTPPEPPASLIADQVTYDRETGLLTAAGSVEVLYQGRVLKASRIVYDERAGEIRAEGPLVLTDPEGGVLIADAAALTPDLEAGLIQGARLLIADQLQLAAAEVRRTRGRYTSLYRTVASTCTICAGDPTPTWSIRAARITQDAVARRIYFEDARLEAFGLPIGYLPRLSVPEPGVARASGVLVPSFHQSDIYGFGFKLPYYRVLGPAADATVTPFVTSTGASLLEGEYRRRTARGAFDLAGVFALNDGLGGDARGFFTGVGAFQLPRDFVAEFDVSIASDDDFLQQFDYSDADRLTSISRILRVRDNDYAELGAVAFQSLRADEDAATVPFVLPEFAYRRLIPTPGPGGRLGLDLDALGILRETGGDNLRLGGGLDWRRDWTLRSGVLAAATTAADVNVWHVWDDPGLAQGTVARAMPSAAIELRWPFARTAGRAAHVIEPIAQVAYSAALGAEDDEIPNEDSRLVEFNETNLFSLSRFPGLDRIETGLRANLGVSYTRYDPAGWSAGFTLGRVLRAEADPDFAEGSGLAGRWSDYVGAVSLDLAWGLSLVDRALFDTDLDFRRNEFAMAYEGERGALRAAYIYLASEEATPVLEPQPETSELALEARYRILRNWELRGSWRYDLVADGHLRAGAELSYGNECAAFDLSVSRRYTSSSNVPPSTSIGFSVRLTGLGDAGSRDWPARVCTRGT